MVIVKNIFSSVLAVAVGVATVLCCCTSKALYTKCHHVSPKALKNCCASRGDKSSHSKVHFCSHDAFQGDTLNFDLVFSNKDIAWSKPFAYLNQINLNALEKNRLAFLHGPPVFHQMPLYITYRQLRL